MAPAPLSPADFIPVDPVRARFKRLLSGLPIRVATNEGRATFQARGPRSEIHRIPVWRNLFHFIFTRAGVGRNNCSEDWLVEGETWEEDKS